MKSVNDTITIKLSYKDMGDIGKLGFIRRGLATEYRTCVRNNDYWRNRFYKKVNILGLFSFYIRRPYKYITFKSDSSSKTYKIKKVTRNHYYGLIVIFYEDLLNNF